MWKKILASVLLSGFVGVLGAGAVNRTMDKTQQVNESQGKGSGEGRNATHQVSEPQGRASSDQGLGASKSGAAPGGGTQNNTTGRQYPNLEAVPGIWETLEGVVLQSPADGVDLVVETDEGEELTIGTGPSYMLEQGFALQAGETIQVQGYWEDDEFKAAQLMRLRDGDTIQLRDQDGRPEWAGAGRNSQGNGRGKESAPGGQSNTGQSQMDEWLQFQGIVTSVDPNALVVQVEDGEQLAVNNRPWWFAQEQGFSAQAGDQIALSGFYNAEHFEVGQLDNITGDQTVLLRDENGHPMWAGRGQRGE